MKNAKEEKRRLNIQLGLGVLLTLAGLVLLYLGFWAVPVGEISNSVLVAFGEISTFAGALVGVDYTYRYRMFKIEEEEKTRREYRIKMKNEDEYYDDNEDDDDAEYYKPKKPKKEQLND